MGKLHTCFGQLQLAYGGDEMGRQKGCSQNFVDPFFHASCPILHLASLPENDPVGTVTAVTVSVGPPAKGDLVRQIQVKPFNPPPPLQLSAPSPT